MKKLFPNEEVIITKYFDVAQDWEVPIPAFFIVASKDKSQRSIAEFSKEQAEEFIKLIVKLRQGMKEVLSIENVYLWQNEDSEYSFHLWLFPRWPWMDKFGNKIDSVRLIMDYAKKNLVTEEVFLEVKEMAKKMKEYMEKNLK